MSLVRLAFCVHYPPPPSNMAAAGRYELKYGRGMSKDMESALWVKELKPWSERWWSLYSMFGDVVREKKMAKSLDMCTNLSKADTKRWAAAFYKEHGDAKPSKLSIGQGLPGPMMAAKEEIPRPRAKKARCVHRDGAGVNTAGACRDDASDGSCDDVNIEDGFGIVGTNDNGDDNSGEDDEDDNDDEDDVAQADTHGAAATLIASASAKRKRPV
jgi:hypothetical protein